MKLPNVDLENGVLRLENTKWNSERLVPMSDSLLAQCRDYYNEMHSTGCFEYFFPSSASISNGKICCDAVRDELNKLPQRVFAGAARILLEYNSFIPRRICDILGLLRVPTKT